MPLPPPVTNARFPERSITTLPQCGVRNVECGMAREARSPSDAPPYTPHSALRIPHLLGKALLHHAANQMLDGEMNFLDPRRVVRGNDQHDVAQVFEPAARMPHEAHDRHPADRKSTRLNSSHPSISYAVFCLKKKNNS